MKRLLTICAVAAFVLAMSATVKAVTINVPGDQPTIQDAVDAATDGDVIHVSVGVYTENIIVDKSVSIHGKKGADVTRVTSQAGGTVFAIIADDVTISGFTIDGSSQFDTAGVLIGGEFPGDERYLGVSGAMVSRCIIEDNSEGVYIWHASNCTIVNNTIRNNLDDGFTAMGGVGIIIWDGNTDAIVQNTPSQHNSLINNEIYKNDHWGIFVGCLPQTPGGTVTCDNTGTKIHGNNLYNNGDFRLLGGDWNWLGIGFKFTSGSKKLSGNKILKTAEGNDIWTYYVTGLKAVGNPVRDALGPNIPMPTP